MFKLTDGILMLGLLPAVAKCGVREWESARGRRSTMRQRQNYETLYLNNL